MFKEFKIVCDCRESFIDQSGDYNDHFSQKSINFIIEKLSKIGYRCIHFGGINDLIKLCQNKQVLENEYFINLSDGLYHKNRRLQAPILLEILGANYSGSEPLAIALANDKATCKKVLHSSGAVRVPQDVILEKSRTINMEKLITLSFPVIVKPNLEGSSIGITQNSLKSTPAEVVQYYLTTDIHKYDSVLVEEYIKGYEVTSLLVGNNYVFPLLIRYNAKTYFENEIMDIEAKRNRQREYLHPNAYLSKECIDRIIQTTINVKECIGLRDIARVDFRVTNNEEIFFIEVNSNPVLSGSSELSAISRIYNTTEEEILNYYMQGFISRVQN